MANVLILTDVDGTLTRDDTMFRFLRFRFGAFGFLIRFLPLIPVLLSYKLGIISNSRAKEWLLTWYLKGETQASLESAGKAFVQHFGESLFRPKALIAMEHWRSSGIPVFMVSASLDFWLVPLAERVGFNAICTRAQYQGGCFTGKFEGKNCNGAEKARRIREMLELCEFEEIHVYGDTKGDLHMLALGTVKYWKPFR